MFSSRQPVRPVIEALEGRQMFSAVPVSPLLSNPVPKAGHYILALTSSANDPSPFTWTWRVNIKKIHGKQFDGWVYVSPGNPFRGASLPDGTIHFSVHYPQFTAPMIGFYSYRDHEYEGVFFYSHDHKDHPGHRGDTIGTFTLIRKNW